MSQMEDLHLFLFIENKSLLFDDSFMSDLYLYFYLVFTSWFCYYMTQYGSEPLCIWWVNKNKKFMVSLSWWAKYLVIFMYHCIHLSVCIFGYFIHNFFFSLQEDVSMGTVKEEGAINLSTEPGNKSQHDIGTRLSPLATPNGNIEHNSQVCKQTESSCLCDVSGEGF